MFTFLEFVKNKVNKKLIDKYGKYRIFSVNGDAVRSSSKQLQEFGGSSYHDLIPSIPKDEIWIEDDIDDREVDVLINSALYQLRTISNGTSPSKAYDEGLKKEKDYRESRLISKKKPWKTSEKAKDIYLDKYGHIKDENIEVWFVNGEKVRNKYKTDFIEGGHGYVYKWVPNNEIWIEYGPHSDDEAPFILLHEYVERILMKYKKMPYEKAHKIAAKTEWKMRCETKGPITKGYSKKEALSLTKEQAESLSSE